MRRLNHFKLIPRLEREAYLKGVASCAIPCIAPALPAILSTSMPIVIREGKACGLIMTSGWIPLSLKGMSIIGHFCEHTPFCPCREENLSPITGDRGIRNVMLILCSSESPASEPRKQRFSVVSVGEEKNCIHQVIGLRPRNQPRHSYI